MFVYFSTELCSID